MRCARSPPIAWTRRRRSGGATRCSSIADARRCNRYGFVMTKRAAKPGAGGGDHPARCRWGRRVLPPSGKVGRRREFCTQACRQWDWVARQRARELELSETDLVIAREALDALRDDLYVLACAVDDVRRDLEAPGKRTERELREAIDWLLDAAGPLRDREIGTSA